MNFFFREGALKKAGLVARPSICQNVPRAVPLAQTTPSDVFAFLIAGAPRDVLDRLPFQ